MRFIVAKCKIETRNQHIDHAYGNEERASNGHTIPVSAAASAAHPPRGIAHRPRRAPKWPAAAGGACHRRRGSKRLPPATRFEATATGDAVRSDRHRRRGSNRPSPATRIESTTTDRPPSTARRRANSDRRCRAYRPARNAPMNDPSAPAIERRADPRDPRLALPRTSSAAWFPSVRRVLLRIPRAASQPLPWSKHCRCAPSLRRDTPAAEWRTRRRSKDRGWRAARRDPRRRCRHRTLARPRGSREARRAPDARRCALSPRSPRAGACARPRLPLRRCRNRPGDPSRAREREPRQFGRS